MKCIRLSRVEPGDFKGRRFAESDLLHVVHEEDTAIYKPDGSVLCVLLKRRIAKAALAAAFPVLRRLRAPPTNRHVSSVGVSSKPELLTGKRSRTVRISTRDNPQVARQSSAIIGFYDRTVRWPFCRATAFNLDHPKEFAQLLPLCQDVNLAFATGGALVGAANNLNERYLNQYAMTAKLHLAWVIPGTVFTTVTVNRNYATAVHKDAGDYRDGFGVMCALRAGQYTGGVTYWPAFGVGVRMDSGDVCLADVHEWHGVTDLVGVPGAYERISCVFYAREKMCRCGSPEQEMQRGKCRQRGEALYE